jgi:hypothetical protein
MTFNERPPNLEMLIAGALLSVAGLLLLLDWAGVIAGAGFGSLWPLVLIGVGVSRLFPSEDGRSRRHGWVFVVVGAFLVLNGTRLLRFREFWPLLLVAIGLVMIWQALSARTPGTRQPQ